MSDHNYSPWLINLDHVAAPCSPQEAVAWLQEHADHMDITVIGEVNGSKFMAIPKKAPPTQVWPPKTEVAK